jgi:hypothetical protein
MLVAMKAEILWNLLRHSEVLWWGDRFLIDAEVAYSVATPGTDLQSLLREMKLSHSKGMANAVAASAANNSGLRRG